MVYFHEKNERKNSFRDNLQHCAVITLTRPFKLPNALDNIMSPRFICCKIYKKSGHFVVQTLPVVAIIILLWLCHHETWLRPGSWTYRILNVFRVQSRVMELWLGSRILDFRIRMFEKQSSLNQIINSLLDQLKWTLKVYSINLIIRNAASYFQIPSTL